MNLAYVQDLLIRKELINHNWMNHNWIKNIFKYDCLTFKIYYIIVDAA